MRPTGLPTLRAVRHWVVSHWACITLSRKVYGICCSSNKKQIQRTSLNDFPWQAIQLKHHQKYSNKYSSTVHCRESFGMLADGEASSRDARSDSQKVQLLASKPTSFWPCLSPFSINMTCIVTHSRAHSQLPTVLGWDVVLILQISSSEATGDIGCEHKLITGWACPPSLVLLPLPCDSCLTSPECGAHLSLWLSSSHCVHCPVFADSLAYNRTRWEAITKEVVNVCWMS